MMYIVTVKGKCTNSNFTFDILVKATSIQAAEEICDNLCMSVISIMEDPNCEDYG